MIMGSDNHRDRSKMNRRKPAISSSSSVGFSKKLMGQIVFLYFIQKKGWLGVAKGADWGHGPSRFSEAARYWRLW
jgi:hypothetical protein